MKVFLSQLHAMGAPPGGAEQGDPGIFGLLFPLILVFGIFYLLVFRPQKKQQKELQNMIQTLKKGDKILTSSGIYGQISNLDDNYATIKIDDNAKMKVLKSSIARILTDEKKEKK